VLDDYRTRRVSGQSQDTKHDDPSQAGDGCGFLPALTNKTH
jgi:hypothetical protein